MAWRAMPRVGLDTGFPASNPWHRFTLTRLPEPSVLVPIGTDLAGSSWGGPSSFGSSTTAPLPAPSRLHRGAPEGGIAYPTRGCGTRPSPEGVERARSLRRTPRPAAGCPVTGRTLQQAPVSDATRRRPSARSDPTPATVSRDVRRPVVAAGLPREPDRPVRGGREHCPCPDAAAPRERRGSSRSPILTAPVGVRSPERASVNTSKNPWSRGISKNTGLSPKLLRYPQERSRHPLVAHRSCTAMCTVSGVPRPPDCIRCRNRVQWGPMSNDALAAIIIIA